MTFKVKGGIQIGANVAFDSDGLIQQIESTPSIRPTVQFDFVRGRTVDSRLTFARSSNATFTGSDGLIHTSTSNSPRIEYNANGECKGLLIEYQGFNLLPTADFFYDSAQWTTSNTYAMPVTSPNGPDGNGPIYKIVEDTNTGEHAFRSPTKTFDPNTQYTYSVYVKAGERTMFDLLLGGPSNWVNGSRTAFFDLTTATITGVSAPATANIAAVGDGWYRCSLTGTSNSTTSAATVSIRVANNVVGSASYTGDGVSGLYVWGPHLEAWGYPSSYVPPVVTFTGRSSNGTFATASGTLVSAGSGVQRFTYNPNNPKADPKILFEPAGTNLITNSAIVTSWYNSEVVLTANSITAPDGTLSATKVGESANTTSTRHMLNPYATVSAGELQSYYSASVFAKAGTKSVMFVALKEYNTYSKQTQAYFDLANGVVTNIQGYNGAGTPTCTMQAYANGWYRCTVSTNLNSTDTNIGVEMIMASSNTNTQYAADGTGYMYLWGLQLEKNTGSTSYIPTSGAQVTRAADTYTAFSSTTRATDLLSAPASSFDLAPSQGTMFVDVNVDGDTSNNQYLFSLGNGSVENLTSIKFSGGYMQGIEYAAGNGQGSVTLAIGGPGNYKTAYAYSNTVALMSLNGSAVYAGSMSGYGVLPYATLAIGSGYDYLRRGYIRNVSYYPHILANTEMQSLTS